MVREVALVSAMQGVWKSISDDVRIKQKTIIRHMTGDWALVDGVKYHRLGNEVHYAQELFETVKSTGYQ